MTPPRPRPHCTFSLRTGLVVVTVLGLLLAFPAWELRRIDQRKRAIAELVEHGGEAFTVDLSELDDRQQNRYGWLRRWFGDVFAVHLEIPPDLQDDFQRFDHLFPEAETMTVVGTPEALSSVTP